MRLELRIAGIDPLRREGKHEILVKLESFLLKHGLQDLVRGARVRRGLEDHQLSSPHVILYLTAGSEDVGHVRVLGLA